MVRTPIPIESPGINVAVVRQKGSDWEFLLLRRASTETYPGYWGLLTGTRENDESVPQLAVREMAEETGLLPSELWASEYIVQFYEPLYDKMWILPVLVAIVSVDADLSLAEENEEARWCDLDRAVELVPWHNLKAILPRLHNELGSYPAANWVKLPIIAE